MIDVTCPRMRPTNPLQLPYAHWKHSTSPIHLTKGLCSIMAGETASGTAEQDANKNPTVNKISVGPGNHASSVVRAMAKSP